MDVGRSARVRRFRFFTPQGIVPANQLPGQPNGAFGMAGGAVPDTPVRWYFAHADAEVFPEAHIWGSSDFDDVYERADRTIGEIPEPGVWNNGRPPVGAVGNHFCGELADFTDAKEYDPFAPLLPRGADGLPFCCAPELNAAFVMTWIEPTVTITVCGDVPIPMTLHVVLNGTGQLAPMFGTTFDVTYQKNLPPEWQNSGLFSAGWVGTYRNAISGYDVTIIFFDFGSLGVGIFLPLGPGQDSFTQLSFSARNCSPFIQLYNAFDWTVPGGYRDLMQIQLTG